MFETCKGLVVISGCCHTGVLNTLLAAQAITGTQEIYALIGGLHLHDLAPEALRALADELRALPLRNLWAFHCTGPGAWALLRESLAIPVQWASTGMTISLPPIEG